MAPRGLRQWRTASAEALADAVPDHGGAAAFGRELPHDVETLSWVMASAMTSSTPI
ncbi:hypothetical protein ACQEU8_03010 [Streptomyces sp. CA-250714]|uniref:hypothetical protein n=1 Tax=Streptomyces sp. CA-250714 TaxID=3240060 RepID=UPI003D89B137